MSAQMNLPHRKFSMIVDPEKGTRKGREGLSSSPSMFVYGYVGFSEDLSFFDVFRKLRFQTPWKWKHARLTETGL